MELGYIIVYVEDVKATVDFYQSALGVPLSFLHESDAYAEMKTGETILAFGHEAVPKLPYRFNRKKELPAGIEISLVTKDVEKAYKRALLGGAESVKKPEEMPWGQTVAYIRDNNGCLVGLCSPMERN